MKKTIQIRPKQVSRVVPRTVAYEKDFYKWINLQVNFLKKKDFSHLDIKNLIEEIESLGISQKKAIKSYCIVLLTHLLKQKHQPKKDCNSWRSSIANARREIQLLCEYSPSLRKELYRVFDDAYQSARKDASYETKIDMTKFENTCPWTIGEALGD